MYKLYKSKLSQLSEHSVASALFLSILRIHAILCVRVVLDILGVLVLLCVLGIHVVLGVLGCEYSIRQGHGIMCACVPLICVNMC